MARPRCQWVLTSGVCEISLNSGYSPSVCFCSPLFWRFVSLLLWGVINASNFLVKSVVTVLLCSHISCGNTLPLCQNHAFGKKTHKRNIKSPLLELLWSSFFDDQRRWTPLTLTLSARPSCCSSSVDCSGGIGIRSLKKT